MNSKRKIVPGYVEYKAKFKNGLCGVEPVELTYCISLDWLFESNKEKNQDRQTGSGFVAFVELVNKHKQQISLLNILFTDHLQRWYVGEEEARTLSEKWRIVNCGALDKLEVPYDFLFWEQYLKRKEYFVADLYVRKFLDEDPIFKDIVDRAASKNAYKAIICDDYGAKRKMAREYLLEECAFILIFDGYLTYPF